MVDDKIVELVRDMFEADTQAGCGFYQDKAWRTAYLQLQQLIGYHKNTCVFCEDTEMWDDLT